MCKSYLFKILSFTLFVSLFSNVAFAVNVPTVSNSQSASPTQQKKVMQKTFGMIKPSGMPHNAEIKSIIASYGLKIIKSKKIIMTEKKLMKLYLSHKTKSFFGELKNSLLDKEVEVMVLYGNNAVKTYRNVVEDIRSKYAVNKTENAVHGADNWKRAHEEICIFFDC